ncbi:TonB-dependent receptor domain-containing protein [Neptunomonas japonica]|uniref:TonB-dependent receptor domain-containing protein n=1 Tax=Neptunomonas japonica TaxID=417574 RepID=UPI000402DF6F|nr:TonB-dependent receptor [Neptunomonas japonica]
MYHSGFDARQGVSWKKNTMSLAVAAIVFAQSATVLAEDNKLTITGQSSAVDSIINQDSLDNFQAADLEDVFQHNPDVSVGGGFSTGQKIYVRGIEDTNLNISIDGAQQAGYLFHHQGRVSIEPELLKQVEVQAGAGLATDGPGALGGAIRFITKDPEDLLRKGEKFGGLVKLGYFDNSNGVKLHSSLFGRLSDDISILASLTQQDAGNTVDGEGNEQGNTKSKINSGLIKVVGQLSEDETLRFSYDFRYDDGTRNVRPHFITAGWNQANKQESHRDTANLQYNLNPAGDKVDLQANLYYTKAYISQKPSGSTRDGAGVKSIGFDLRNTQQIDNHSLTYGTDFRRDTGYYINSSTPGFQDEVLNVAGLYAQDQIALTEKLTLNTGLRYDYYDIDDNTGQTFKTKGLSPNIGLNYAVNQALDIHGGYARALRGVNVKEAYLLNFATNDPNRKAEKADNFELGFDYSKNRISFGATAYVSHINNAVTRVSRSVYGNEGDVENKGVTAYVGYNWDNTDLHLGYSYNRPEIDGKPLDDGDMAIGTAVGDTLTASVTHMLPEKNLEFGWSSQVVQRLTDVPSGRSEKAGYAVHDAYAKWYPQGNEDLAVTLTVKNMFDKQYLSHASYGVSTSSGQVIGLPEAGRDIRLTLAARF